MPENQNQDLSNKLKTSIRELKQSQKILRISSVLCIIAVVVLLLCFFLPTCAGMNPEEKKTAEAVDTFMNTLKSGGEEPDNLTADFPFINDLKASGDGLPDEYVQAYRSLLIRSWEIASVQENGSEYEVDVTVDTVDPASFSLSEYEDGLKEVLNQESQSYMDSLGGSEPDKEALSAQLKSRAYGYLTERFNELPADQKVTLRFVINRDSGEIESVEQKEESK